MNTFLASMEIKHYFCKQKDNISINVDKNYKHKNTDDMGKLIYFLCFILSVFPADVNENRRHIHVTRKGNKKSHRGDTVAKIWIEENGKKKIEVCWSELNAKDESAIIDVIDKNWDAINEMINKIFAGESVDIIRIRKK